MNNIRLTGLIGDGCPPNPLLFFPMFTIFSTPLVLTTFTTRKVQVKWRFVSGPATLADLGIYTSISTFLCERTFPGRCRYALQLCARSGASAGQSLDQRPASSHWLQFWHWRDSTMAVLRWTPVGSQCSCSTRLLGAEKWAYLRFSVISTGFEMQEY